MDEQLRRGDEVEVRSPAEILATLDDRGTLAGLPFMPEMITYCGRRFTVAGRADKICDTVKYTGSRKLPDAVMLEDLRCDGSGHDGCQAACRIFWKEAWLRRVPRDAQAPSSFPQPDAATLLARVSPATRSTAMADGNQQTRYWCQNTGIPDYSHHLKVWDPRPYINEYTCGNVPLGRALQVTVRAVVTEPLRKLGLVREIHLPGTATKGQRFEPLHLSPGELVRIKPKEEIAKTLTPDGRSGGLWFDEEMLRYCGETHRVRDRIKRFIDERNGKLVMLKSDALTLEGVVCSGEHSARRWFCPRAIYSYWREAWLERVEARAARP